MNYCDFCKQMTNQKIHLDFIPNKPTCQECVEYCFQRILDEMEEKGEVFKDGKNEKGEDFYVDKNHIKWN